MMQSCVRTLARTARAIALAAVVTGFSAAALEAQSTGKLQGNVRDQGGQPVANARVLIVGTSFVTTANPQGYYFFNSVPAGEYSVRFTYVGYRPVERSGVRIQSGQTLTLDQSLEATAVEIEAITVVAADNPLVPRDQVTSKQLIDGDFTDKLPVDRLNQVFALQPGVMANSSGSTLSVRGGRPDENSTYIDGVPVQPGNRATGSGGRAIPTVSVGTNSFEDASITTGATSAEFGNAQGGVIAITTKTGGQTFSGNFGYETDEFSGLTQSQAFNRVQASLGGPITRDLTFFVGGVLEGTRAGYQGYRAYELPSWTAVGVDTTYTVARSTSATSDSVKVNVYNYALFRGDCDANYAGGNSDAEIANNYGVDCKTNSRQAYSPASVTQLTGKLNYSFGQGSRVSLSYITSRAFSRGTRGADGTTGNSDISQVATLNWNQVLTRSSSRSLAIDAYLSYQTNTTQSSLITAESEESTRDPFGGFLLSDFDYAYDRDDFPVTQELIDAYRVMDNDARIVLYDRFNTTQYEGQTSYSGHIIGGGGGGGTAPGTLATTADTRWIGKVNLDWQLDRYNRLKIGGEYTDSKIDQYNIGSATAGFSDIWLAEPVRYNLFVEDRLDLGDVVLVGGVRYDYFKINAEKWDSFPRISSHPDFNGETYVEDLMVPYESHDYISPHIQVAFPVTERTNFRLSYAQMVQAPDYSVALTGSNTDLSITNTNQNYGSDLDFGKTILFEFGVRHAFNDDMVLDVTVYNKDNLSNAAGRLIGRTDPRTGGRADVRLTVNQDFGNTRGIDLRLDRRFGNIFNGVLSYSFQDARNTGSDPYTYISFGSRITSAVTGTASPPPQAAQPVGYSRPHSIAAQAAFNFPADYKEGSFIGSVMSQVGITAIARYSSGLPYTRCDAEYDDDLSVLSGNPCSQIGGDFNATRLPAFKNVDLRVTKGFRLGSLDFTAYADARNVFNFENINDVFAITGSVQNDRYREQLWASDSAGYAQLGTANGLRDASTGSINLPTDNAACAAWKTTSGQPSAPTCHFWRQGEQRFGNGDGVYTLEEQRVASDISRMGNFHISRFAGAGRLLRFGMEVSF
jgi:hypothetical protein